MSEFFIQIPRLGSKVGGWAKFHSNWAEISEKQLRAEQQNSTSVSGDASVGRQLGSAAELSEITSQSNQIKSN